MRRGRWTVTLAFAGALAQAACAPHSAPAPADRAAVVRAFIDDSGPQWRTLTRSDFQEVNGAPDTWRWDGTMLRTTGQPIGVYCTVDQVRNAEFTVEWRHLQPGGNSGVFVWVHPVALRDLPPGSLPRSGIEVQMLDHDFRPQYEQRSGRPSDWFTTDGDVFAVGASTMRHFAPLSPDGSRSFPRERRSRPSPEWNHYYVRAINGELRLWVNGGEVSGGQDADPREGHLCLEAEGAPVEFRSFRIRELP